MARQDALIAVLRKSFDECWSRETSADPENWTPENPSWGHCAVASLIAQTVLGGELLRYDLKGTPYERMGSHYKVRLADGTILDFTEAQFQGRPPVWGEPALRTRADLLDPNTERDPKRIELKKKTLDRYRLFSRRVSVWLDGFKAEE